MNDEDDTITLTEEEREHILDEDTTEIELHEVDPDQG